MVEISSDEEASDGPQKKKKPKTESKIKTKVIDGKQKCVHVEYVYETETDSESEQDNASASESPESPPPVKKPKRKMNETKGTVNKDVQEAPNVKRSHKVPSQQDMQNTQNTVVQTTECVKTDLQVGANMPAVGIQEAAPPTPVTRVMPQPTFMPSNLQHMAQDPAQPSIVQDPVTGKVQMDITDFSSLMGFVR